MDDVVGEIARQIGIDPKSEGHLMFIARQAASVMPLNWRMERSGGSVVFRDARSNAVRKEHPQLDHFRSILYTQRLHHNMVSDPDLCYISTSSVQDSPSQFPERSPNNGNRTPRSRSNEAVLAAHKLQNGSPYDRAFASTTQGVRTNSPNTRTPPPRTLLAERTRSSSATSSTSSPSYKCTLHGGYRRPSVENSKSPTQRPCHRASPSQKVSATVAPSPKRRAPVLQAVAPAKKPTVTPFEAPSRRVSPSPKPQLTRKSMDRTVAMWSSDKFTRSLASQPPTRSCASPSSTRVPRPSPSSFMSGFQSCSPDGAPKGYHPVHHSPEKRELEPSYRNEVFPLHATRGVPADFGVHVPAMENANMPQLYDSNRVFDDISCSDSVIVQEEKEELPTTPPRTSRTIDATCSVASSCFSVSPLSEESEMYYSPHRQNGSSHSPIIDPYGEGMGSFLEFKREYALPPPPAPLPVLVNKKPSEDMAHRCPSSLDFDNGRSYLLESNVDVDHAREKIPRHLLCRSQ